MFTSGQILFGEIFATCFVLFMIVLYRKDLKIHKRYYSKVWQVGLVLVLAIVLFTILVFTLHK